MTFIKPRKLLPFHFNADWKPKGEMDYLIFGLGHFLPLAYWGAPLPASASSLSRFKGNLGVPVPYKANKSWHAACPWLLLLESFQQAKGSSVPTELPLSPVSVRMVSAAQKIKSNDLKSWEKYIISHTQNSRFSGPQSPLQSATNFSKGLALFCIDSLLSFSTTGPLQPCRRNREQIPSSHPERRDTLSLGWIFPPILP
jgi:hypothetical protein